MNTGKVLWNDHLNHIDGGGTPVPVVTESFRLLVSEDPPVSRPPRGVLGGTTIHPDRTPTNVRPPPRVVPE